MINKPYAPHGIASCGRDADSAFQLLLDEINQRLESLPEKIGEHKRLNGYKTAIDTECRSMAKELPRRIKQRIGVVLDAISTLAPSPSTDPVEMTATDFMRVCAVLGGGEMVGQGFIAGFWYPCTARERGDVCTLLDHLDAWEEVA